MVEPANALVPQAKLVALAHKLFVGVLPLMVTASVRAVPFPQLVDGVTVMVPLLLPVVTVMLLVVEVPLQPLGNAQV